MFRVIILALLCMVLCGAQAEGAPYDYTKEIRFTATDGDYTGKVFVYQIRIRPSTVPDHEKRAQDFLDWSHKRLEQELKLTNPSGCTQELKDVFWKILEDELTHRRGLSVSTFCTQDRHTDRQIF